jgi:gamma-glutamyl:cysteine ligase YbdK (ATP-grasp superfamily)
VGTEIERERFDEGDYRRFRERLERSLDALRELLDRPGFGEGPRSLGAELELFLVDARARPLPLNEAVLRETVDPRVTVELDRFNLECNLRPSPLAGRPFTALRHEMEDALAELRRAASAHGGRIALVGILPTLRPEDLQGDAMTDSARFRALSAALQRLRREPFRVRIAGADPLDISCDDVTFEGANTSLQVHLRVSPRDFGAVYNALQLATGPALAVAGNSPTFLGHCLWEETRIALFKQAVDPRGTARGRVPRVGFGTGWIREGAWQLFSESVALHEPLLPIVSEDDPLEQVRAGGVPALPEMRLHQGTVWSWNRAIYDPGEGGHLRVEMRGLPAGPGVDDMLANTAFLVGLGLGIAPEIETWIAELPFALAEHNFYRAAQAGLDAELLWPPAPGQAAAPVRARELVARLLDLARRGLDEAGVDPAESAALLEVVSQRARTGRTGAAWQREALARLETGLGRQRALPAMLESYLHHSEHAGPVHAWPAHGGAVRVLAAPLPDELPDSVEAFLAWLGGPALLRLAGRDRSRARAVSTLLHGNEPSGLRAVHAFLRSGAQPAVDTLFFVGAVAAALEPPGFAHRRLPGAADLNRCFLPPHRGAEGEVAHEALALLRSAAPEALVDLHNNTGHNPPYGVGPRAGPIERRLVACFGRRFVASDLALGALVEATAGDFPSVTIECGRAGDPAADHVAREGLARLLECDDLGALEPPDLELFGDPVRVRMRPGARLAVAPRRDAGAHLTLDDEVDRHNFECLEPGHCLGWVGVEAGLPVEARDAAGRDRSRELFEVEDGELRTRRPIVPIMMTTDPAIAAQDCLFYAVAPQPAE